MACHPLCVGVAVLANALQQAYSLESELLPLPELEPLPLFDLDLPRFHKYTHIIELLLFSKSTLTISSSYLRC